MYTISNEAEIFIAELFEEQGEKDLALQVEIEKAGTPVANVTFGFCRPSDLHRKQKKFSYKGFDAYIWTSNLDYLKDSDVALKSTPLPDASFTLPSTICTNLVSLSLPSPYSFIPLEP